MLNEIPQTTSIKRFRSIEELLHELSSLPSIDNKLCHESSDILCPVHNSLSSQTTSEMCTLEISNEMSDGQRKCKNVVIHNVPENDNPDKGTEVVENILKDILGEVPVIQTELKTTKARIYRLGRQVPGKNRTTKCHLTSEENREQLLAQSGL